MSNAKQIENVNDARTFVTAGRAIVTFHNPATGGRFTYRVEQGKKIFEGAFFVSVLTGSNNETDYRYLGMIRQNGEFSVTRASKISADAPSAKAFGWVWNRFAGGDLKGVEVLHEGRCGKCGRTLTVPESIKTGIGPTCAGKMGVGS